MSNEEAAASDARSISESITAHDGAGTSDCVIVVTGLPRSGTSLMMQMLEAGGISVHSDGRRRADEDNPRGYFEHEAVKNLRKDSSWVPDCRGTALKVVVPLVPYLPRGDYRFLYMERPLDEVLRSQRLMLERTGKTGARLSNDQLKSAFANQVAAVGRWLAANGRPVMKVDYGRCIETPESVAASVNQFLGGQLEVEKMAGAVDAGLYRNRTQEKFTAAQGL